MKRTEARKSAGSKSIWVAVVMAGFQEVEQALRGGLKASTTVLAMDIGVWERPSHIFPRLSRPIKRKRESRLLAGVSSGRLRRLRDQ